MTHFRTNQPRHEDAIEAPPYVLAHTLLHALRPGQFLGVCGIARRHRSGELYRRTTCADLESGVIRVRLTRKLASRLNGIDVSGCRVGDVIELPEEAARMLIAEGWADTVVDNPLPKARPAISRT